MPRITPNPHRKTGLGAPAPVDDPARVAALLRRCPHHAVTPLLEAPALAAHCAVDAIWIKDERARMGLGSFKALGAAFAIACAAHDLAPDAMAGSLRGRTFVTASAGNHGLSVAVGAQVFGAQAVIYLSRTVPEGFAARLRDLGAAVVTEGRDYEESMAAAAEAAAQRGWTLLSDSTWEGYVDLPMQVMEGYLQLAHEAASQLPVPPSHILLQAGVGGLASAVAAYARKVWGDGPQIIVVEPEAAPALAASILAGKVVETEGPVSSMGRLDCKTPSMVALNGLARDADLFVTITEEEAADGVAALGEFGYETSPSGGAGLAALIAGLDLGKEAQVWAILSEGPADD